MYESFFGFRRRPFASAADARWYAPTESSEAARSELVRCIDETRGIAVMSAAAGLGKSMLCRKLAFDMQRDWAIAELPNATSTSSQSLLQAVLYALGQPYSQLSEDELRHSLTSVAKSVRPDRRGVLVILDEAHLLKPLVLEELRILTNLVDHEGPLFQIVIAGQLPLEETLARPEMEAFRQRIGCQVTIEPYSLADSIQYLTERIECAGAKLEQVLDSDALRLIPHASNGLPRCLNQLTDQSLLLGFLHQKKPIGEEIVRLALEDLKQLPLHWNEPARVESSEPKPQAAADSHSLKASHLADATNAAPCSETCIEAPTPTHAAPWESTEGMASFEVGGEATASHASESPLENSTRQLQSSLPADPAESVPPAVRHSSAAAEEQAAPKKTKTPTTHESKLVKPSANARTRPRKPRLPEEETIVDRYALLDAGRPAPEPSEPITIHQDSVEVTAADESLTDSIPQEVSDDLPLEQVRLPQPEHLLERLVPMIDAAISLDGGPTAIDSSADDSFGRRTPRPENQPGWNPRVTSEYSLEEQIGVSVLETCLETREAIHSRFPVEDAVSDGFEPMREEELRPASDFESSAAASTPQSADVVSRWVGAMEEPKTPRPYSRLFSALRKKNRRAG